MSKDRWTQFYSTGEYERCAYLAGEKMDKYVEHFFSFTGTSPDSFASVGCGPAMTEFALADRYPNTDFYCYDVSTEVIQDNRKLAKKRGMTNISFLTKSLPDLKIRREFDIVYCMATLYFVKEIESSIKTLYHHVEPGGYLIFNYPSPVTREWLKQESKQKQEFFAPVDSKKNILTQNKIRQLLGAEPRSYWDLVGASDELSDNHPAVFVQR